MMYLYGDYVNSDPEIAEKWLLKSSNQNNGWAQFNLANIYINSLLGFRDLDLAIEYLNKSVSNNYYYSYYYLGLIHEDLNAGYYDIKKSISYFEKGDLNNVFQTQTRLCNLYSFKYINHTEINKDVDLAIEYCKAVSQNDAEAQYLLGQIYCLEEFAIFNFDEWF